MTSSRSRFLARFPARLLTAAGAVCALALASPAAHAADADASAAAPSAHHGLAFTPSVGAKARIVEPDGRVVMSDGVSDLVSPSSITERRVHTAIAQLVRAAVPAKRRATEVMAAPTLQAP